MSEERKDENKEKKKFEATLDVSREGVKLTVALDDEQRVKVLSPSSLVIKRFLRNKLAIVGMCIIIFMFIFSFIGGIVNPYGQTETFKTDEYMEKDYASIAHNEDFRYTDAPGKNFTLLSRAQFVLALNSGKDEFDSPDGSFRCEEIGENFYMINEISPAVKVFSVRNSFTFEVVGEFDLTSEAEEKITEALNNKEESFEYGGVEYSVINSGREYYVGTYEPTAIASFLLFDEYDPSFDITYDFKLAAEMAITNGKTSFQVDGNNYSLETDSDVTIVYLEQNGSKTEYANISEIVVQPYAAGDTLTIGFKAAAKEALADGLNTFEYEENGETGKYAFYQGVNMWTIKKVMITTVISTYESPSSKHLLGTDGNGMDVVTRIMYGGRVSLIIGFIVIIIELFIGVILGGLAGYFGGWVDMLIMRLTDVFMAIPSLPLLIIIGGIFDAVRLDPSVRIMYLMVILGLLSWPSTARIVRGQILSLREQEFMIATEATGISVYRRIFRHLIPNVIPQLIVIATMGLGQIIITEAILSFLGLGVKYPFASWGNIVSAVSNVYVMTNYGYIWIPAGLCILITVLGFNFIGDGLRDAFDPKMKR